jgi:predicted MFS family arabinose efflux permease
MAMAIPHGVMEAIQSPGTQAAVADAARRDDAAAAQGLAEASGSAAAAIGAFTAAPLFAALGAGPAWLIAGVVMAGLLVTSSLLDRPRLVRARHDAAVGASSGAATANRAP